MSSLNSRFKSFGLGKRKSVASIHSIQQPAPPTSAGTPPPAQIPQHQAPHPGQTPPPGAASSTTSLPMNHPGQGARPPSYSAGSYPQAPQGQPMGRTSPMTGQNRTPPSQMTGGPPPINTGAPTGYPPNMNPMGQMPPGMPQGGPPGFGQPTGYPPGPPPAGGPIAQQFQQQGNPAAEVEGSSRSKAQLIVGIDFVSTSPLRFPSCQTLFCSYPCPGSWLGSRNTS